MRAAIVLPLFLVACGGGFSNKEAERVVEDVNTISNAAYGSLQVDALGALDGSRAVDGDLTFDVTDDTASFSGTITSDGQDFFASWTGTMEVDGSVSISGDELSWDLDVGYIDVTFNDTTYNGDTTWSMDVGGDFGAGEYTLSYSLVGDLVAEGEVNGEGSVDWTATWVFSSSEISMSASGTVGNKTVDWSFSFDLSSLF